MKSWKLKIAALALSAILMAANAFAAGNWEGVWKVKDSGGQPFEITLAADGTAKASLHEEMVGTWTGTEKAAVIKWKTGWTTKITKSGDKYKKTGYRPGSKKPSNKSDAEKVQ